MNDINLMKRLLNALPFAYICHKYVDNKLEREEKKYIFVAANHEFELLTSMPKEDYIGRSISEVDLKIDEQVLKWAEIYKSVNSKGENIELIKFYQKRKQYYKIIACQVMQEYFVCLFDNITQEMTNIEKAFYEEVGKNNSFRDMELIFNSTSDSMALLKVVNNDFVYVRNNRIHESFFGKVDEKTLEMVLGKNMGVTINNKLSECCETKKIVQFEIEYPLERGNTAFLTSLTPVIENKCVKYIVSSSKDITEFKKLQQTNADKERSVQAMFDKHMAIMLLLEPDSGRILDANPSACTFYGYTKDEMLDMCIQDINILSASQVSKLREKAFLKEQVYFGFSHKCKDGTIRKVDVYSCPIEDKKRKMLFSIIFDVTDREEFRNKLESEKELLEITLKSIGDGVVTTDLSGNILSMNKAAIAITGWSEEEVIGKSFPEIFVLTYEESMEKIANPIEIVLRTGTTIGLTNHTELRSKTGKMVPVADSAAPIKNSNGSIFGAVMVFRDVSYEKQHQDQILYLSYHDSLTSLYNRRYMDESLDHMNISECSNSILIIGDVNGLKLTNDVFGHEAGDELLKTVSNILSNNCRNDDVLARWGGDEFLMLFPNTDIKVAEKIIFNIKSECEKKSIEKIWISLAMGSARIGDFGSISGTIQSAEEKMYHQKFLDGKSYRNRIINAHLVTLDNKSFETKQHAERLKKYCLAIARLLGLNAEDCDLLSLLSVLHDIGKIGIQESILNKNGALTKEEWVEMKKHSEIGYRMAKSTPELEKVAEYILSHHERWDGMGYPRGLKAKEIPLPCRILSVVDAYDAMTHDRIYRKAMDEPSAVVELKENAGTQFDPQIVTLFMNVLEKK